MSEYLDKKFKDVISEDIRTLERRYGEAESLAQEYHTLVMGLAGGDAKVFEQHSEWFSAIARSLEVARKVLGKSNPSDGESVRSVLHALAQNVQFMNTQLGRIAPVNDMANVVPFPGVLAQEVRKRGVVQGRDDYAI